MSDIAATFLGLAIAASLGMIAFVLHRRWETEDQRRISDLINGNRAAPRPGMGARDDSLLRRAEERARARRAP